METREPKLSNLELAIPVLTSPDLHIENFKVFHRWGVFHMNRMHLTSRIVKAHTFPLGILCRVLEVQVVRKHR